MKKPSFKFSGLSGKYPISVASQPVAAACVSLPLLEESAGGSWDSFFQ